MPRVWRVPQWIKDQYDAGAVKKGFAMVKNFGHGQGFAKLVWRNSYGVEDDQEGRDLMVRLEIDGKTYIFDSQELAYWLKYA